LSLRANHSHGEARVRERRFAALAQANGDEDEAAVGGA
jgi:hypothetical protein